MKRFLHSVIFSLALVSLVAAAEPAKILVNVDKTGLGLQGYDPVGFFTPGKPVKGNAQFKSTYNGVIYYFASAGNKKLFDDSPAKYEPQFGGYCAYGVSRGKTVSIEVDAFQIVNGRLLLQYDKGIRDDFNEDTQGNFKLANQKWPELVAKNGKPAPTPPQTTPAPAAGNATTAPVTAPAK